MRVALTGRRDVTAPATWSQLGIWRTMLKARPHDGSKNIRFAVCVPRSRTVQEVVDVVAEVVSAHEALRTVHPLTAAGELTQVVSRRSELEVAVVDAREGDPSAHVLDEFADAPFDHPNDLPARFAVVVDGNGPRDLFVVISPLSVDWVAEQLVRRELARCLGGHRADCRPDSALRPIDVALHERSAAGRSASRLALARWADFLALFEPTNFPDRLPTDTTPRWVSAEIRSRRLAAAVERLREGSSLSASATYHAASAVMIAALSGRSTAVMHNMTSNRVSRAESKCVGRLAQASVSAVEVASLPFHEVVVAAAGAGVRSYAMGHYSTADVDALIDADSFDGFHNSRFHRFTGPSAIGGGGTARPAREADPVVGAVEPLRFFTHKFAVEVSHEDGDAVLSLVADRWYLPTSAPERLLMAMRALVVDAAVDADPPPAVTFVERLL